LKEITIFHDKRKEINRRSIMRVSFRSVFKIKRYRLAVAALALILATMVLPFSCYDGEDSSRDKGGIASPWPKWVFEHWVWYDESTQDEAIQLVNDYMANDIPVGAVVIDSPWATGYNTFEFDPALYPDPEGMIDWFHDNDIRVVVWITPVINAMCDPGAPICPEQDLYNEGMANHYFMGDGDLISWWKCPADVTFCGALIDYFNPDALAWWHQLMDPILGLGIDGWKCDTIEPMSLTVSISPYAGPTEPWEFNDRFYLDFFEYTRSQLGPDRVIMARPVEAIDLSGLVGKPAFLAFPHAKREINFAGWVGDQDPTFEGLQLALINIYLSAEVGYLSLGSDIGGYRGATRPKEVFIRWAQFGAMCPLMENGGGGEHRPWMIGGDTVDRMDTTDIYRDYVDLHYQLIPYMHQQAKEAWAQGRSLMQVQKDDNDIWTWEYLLGSDILVVPMYESGTTRTVRFPAGDDWVYLWDRGQEYAGGTEATLDFPLDEFPIFLRKGSAIEQDPDLP
jgi:alpha-glucosidase (family GH31 glycosyl hydrolase)